VFSSHPDAELCAVVARHEDRAQARAAEWGTRAYTSIDEMLSRERPDLVTLSLPNEGHFEATLEVIEAGAPLLAEKPLVFDLAQADQLIGAAARRDLFFAINFNHRFAEPVKRAKESQVTVRTHTRTSSRLNATVWTCSSSFVGPSSRSWPR
jgi:predicted dehydrogenase